MTQIINAGTKSKVVIFLQNCRPNCDNQRWNENCSRDDEAEDPSLAWSLNPGKLPDKYIPVDHHSQGQQPVGEELKITNRHNNFHDNREGASGENQT